MTSRYGSGSERSGLRKFRMSCLLETGHGRIESSDME